MIIDKVFKLLRKVQEGYKSGGKVRHSPPLKDPDYNYDRRLRRVTTLNTNLFNKERKRKLGVGVSEDHVIEVLHTTTTGISSKFHMPNNNTLIIEAPHSVDIIQEKLTNVEDLGSKHRYYGKGKTVINFSKEPKEWPENPVDEFGEEININELTIQCNRGSCIKEQHSNIPKPIEWSNKPQIHKESALKVEKDKQQKLRNKLTLSTEEYERMLDCINKEN